MSDRFLAGPDLVTADELRAAGSAWAALFGEREVPSHRYDTADLPFVTPETWAMLRDGCDGKHSAETCPACAYYRRLDQDHYAAPWAKHHRVERERPRWSDVEEALRYYATVVMHGYPSTSMAAVLLGYNELGCWTQREERRGNAAERAADDVVLVEGAMYYAFGERRGLGCAVLLARKGGDKPVDEDALAARTGLDVVELRGIVRRGLRAIRVDLAARGAIPMPGRGSPTVREAIARRREEIGHG